MSETERAHIMEESTPSMSAATYKCPNCGSAVHFGVRTQRLDCPHCGSSFAIEDIRPPKPVEAPERVHSEFGEEVRAYSCPSCGARVVVPDGAAATFCVFCRNPTLLADRLRDGFKPSRILPFRQDIAEAKKKFREHCRGALVPAAFREKKNIEHIRGLYAPFWLFSCRCHAKVTLHCEKKIRWSTSSHDHTKTEIYEEVREGDFTFSNVPADGSKALDDVLMQKIEPFDYSKLRPFEMAYLAGHLAEVYDVPAEAVAHHVKRRVRQAAEDALRCSATGYASVSVKHSKCKISDMTSEYVMAPVWILVSRHKDKNYVFAMNGQTRNLAGDLPLCWKRAMTWFGGVGAGVAAVIALACWL